MLDPMALAIYCLVFTTVAHGFFILDGIRWLYAKLFDSEMKAMLRKADQWAKERKRDHQVNQLVASLEYRTRSIHEPQFIIMQKEEIKLLLDHVREVQSA